MKDLILVAILLLIFGLVVFYIIRAKKKGVKCIGCPNGAKCSGKCAGCSGNCSGCGGNKEIK